MRDEAVAGEIESVDVDVDFDFDGGGGGGDDDDDDEGPPLARDNLWAKLLGTFVRNRSAVFVLVALIAVAGIWASPFAWDTGLPRDPVPVDAIPDIG